MSTGMAGRRWKVGAAGLLGLGILAHASPARGQSTRDMVYVGVRATTSGALDERPGRRRDPGIVVTAAPPPIVLAPRDRLSVGLAYRTIGIDLLDGAALEGEPSARAIHALDLSLAYTRVLGPRWFGTAAVIPGLRSDLRDTISTRDFNVSGILGLTYLVGGNPRFRLTFGVAAQLRWSFAPVIPFVSVAYANELVAIDAGVGGLSAVARLGSRVELGVFASFGADWYHVAPMTNPRLAAARFFRPLEVVAGPQANVRLYGPLWLNARTGYTIVRQGTYGDDDRDRIGGVSLDGAGVFVGQLGFSIRNAPR